jgi:hypothetical protein
MILPAVMTSPVMDDHHTAVEPVSPIDHTQEIQDGAVEPTPGVPESDTASESEEATLQTSPE